MVPGAPGNILWTVKTQDNSSSVTGSSVFDFDGNGVAEVIYGDECYLRVYDGQDGSIEFQAPNTSCTAYEMPVVADVDGTGAAGLLVPSNNICGITCPYGTHHQNDAAAATIPVLEQAAAQLRDQLGSIPGVVVEHKRFGVAVHYRNAARDRVGEVAAAVRAAGRRDALRVAEGSRSTERLPRTDGRPRLLPEGEDQGLNGPNGGVP